MTIPCKQCGYAHKAAQTCLEAAHKRGGLEEAIRIGELLLQRKVRERRLARASQMRDRNNRGPITVN